MLSIYQVLAQEMTPIQGSAEVLKRERKANSSPALLSA